MNKAEYADYERRMTAADAWLLRFDPKDPDEEGYFSHFPCGVCDRPTAGHRTECTWVNTNGRHGEPLNVCDDCIYYQEYGRLDDQTMMDMENEQ